MAWLGRNTRRSSTSDGKWISSLRQAKSSSAGHGRGGGSAIHAGGLMSLARPDWAFSCILWLLMIDVVRRFADSFRYRTSMPWTSSSASSA